MAIQQVAIPIREVHCPHCERAIGAALSKLPGVLKVEASSKTSQVVVQREPSRTDVQAPKGKLLELGFGPED